MQSRIRLPRCPHGTVAAESQEKMELTTTAGAWLSTIQKRFSGTKLTTDDLLDNIAIQCGQRPANLPDQCNGCGAGLTLEHGLSCKRGGLISICHDDVHDEWAHLCCIALTNSQVVIKPTIFYGNGLLASANNATQSTPHTANPTNTLREEAHSDVLAHGFWNRGRGTSFDVCICDTDSHSYGTTSSSEILKHHVTEKKDKNESACLECHRDFTPLVYSVDGMASKDGGTAKRCLAWLLTKTWSRTYSDMANFVCTRMSLAIAQSNTLLLFLPTFSSSVVLAMKSTNI
ncbi:hypothetical protein ACHAW6_006188 [Cyclotella cf. meneghiniana]